jgi:hypothetical protein
MRWDETMGIKAKYNEFLSVMECFCYDSNES